MKTNKRPKKPGGSARKNRDSRMKKNSVSETRLVGREKRKRKNVGVLKLLAWTKNVRNEPRLKSIVLLQVVDLPALVLEERMKVAAGVAASMYLPAGEARDQAVGPAVVAAILAEVVMTAAMVEGVAAFAMAAAAVEEEINVGVKLELKPHHDQDFVSSWFLGFKASLVLFVIELYICLFTN